MLEILIVPSCFLGAGLLGLRLGTPPRVVGGLIAVGCFHLLAFLGADQALNATGSAADWVHLVSQWLFLSAFVALVWLAAAYPTQRPPTRLIVAAAALAVVGPVAAALSGPTPSLINDKRQLGPVLHLLPAGIAGVAAAPLMLLPVLAVVIFVLRYRRANVEDRAAMRWPIAGLGLIALLVLTGTLLSAAHQGIVTAIFLLGAPVFPLALTFGPVVRRLDALSAELSEIRERLVQGARPRAPEGVLATLTPRELTVLEHMAAGMANPVIARTMHLSLSSVEKHSTSIFRKLHVPEGPDVHRRVSAVVAYRDVLDQTEEQPKADGI